jgi:hypothetical protein
MKLTVEISARLESLYSYVEIPNGLRMNTHCLYPNNGFVKVAVYGAGDTFFVTDEGGAIREAELSGAVIEKPDASFGKSVKDQGLFMQGGVIVSPKVALRDLVGAIALVANASKDVADKIFDEWRLARNRDFKEMLKRFLKSEFSEKRVHAQDILGTSMKPHSFDTVVQFMDGSRLLVDAVLKDTKSINSRVVANLDVKNAEHPNLTQRLVYDDDEDWSVTDLNLLGVAGIPVIPFSKSSQLLKGVWSN